jgi:hypothetical protein
MYLYSLKDRTSTPLSGDFLAVYELSKDQDKFDFHGLHLFKVIASTYIQYQDQIYLVTEYPDPFSDVPKNLEIYLDLDQSALMLRALDGTNISLGFYHRLFDYYE